MKKIKEYITNPISGRSIIKGGRTHKLLMNAGKLPRINIRSGNYIYAPDPDESEVKIKQKLDEYKKTLKENEFISKSPADKNVYIKKQKLPKYKRINKDEVKAIEIMNILRGLKDNEDIKTQIMRALNKGSNSQEYEIKDISDDEEDYFV
jgi:hypothetical protein